MRIDWASLRAEKLIAAAAAGDLAYNDIGWPCHRSASGAHDIPLTGRDAELLAELVREPRLRRAESGAITTTSTMTRSSA